MLCRYQLEGCEILGCLEVLFVTKNYKQDGDARPRHDSCQFAFVPAIPFSVCVLSSFSFTPGPHSLK